MKGNQVLALLIAQWVVTSVLGFHVGGLSRSVSVRPTNRDLRQVPFPLASVPGAGKRSVLCMSTGEATPENGASSHSDEAVASADQSPTEPNLEGGSWLQRFRRRMFPPKDGLTFRKRLAKMGLSVVLSYGWVSNMSYSVSVSLAWYIFCKRTGLSPLAPGQWKGFLGVYMGFYVFNNFVRPVRVALSVSVSMYFDRIVDVMQRRFHVKRGPAIGITVFLANIVGTIAAMCTGISLASMAAGVAIFPAKA